MRQEICDNIMIEENRHKDGFFYTYELILREGVRTADFRLPLYSIRISLTDGQGRKSQKEARDVFTDRKKAERLFTMLTTRFSSPPSASQIIVSSVLYRK